MDVHGHFEVPDVFASLETKCALPVVRFRLDVRLEGCLPVALFSLCCTAVAWADGTPPGTTRPQAEEVVELGPFEVTGSIIKRAETEGTAPVKVITRAEIEESGRSSVSEYLLQLPEAGYSSNNENASALGTNYRGMSVLNLRGFDPNNTLVLVDGRRPVLSGIGWNTAMFTDLNRFPAAMVERVELLQDSGTLYGSGSAGGVVNIIRRQNYHGAEVTARYDGSLRTDVGKRSFSLVAGANRGSTNLTVGVTYGAQHSLRAGDTEFARTANLTSRFAAKGAAYAARAAVGSFDFRSNVGPQARVWLVAGQFNGLNGVNIPGLPPGAVVSRLPGVAVTAATNTANAATPNFTSPSLAGSGGQFNAAAAATFVAQVLARNVEPSNYYDQNEPVWLTPRTERIGFDVSVQHAISPQVTAYARASFQHNWSYIVGTVDTVGGQLVPRTNFWNPFGVDVMVGWSPVELGGKTSSSIDETTAALLGARGIVGGNWRWDTAAAYGFDRNTEVMGNYLSSQGWAAAIAKSTSDALNVFGGAGYRNPRAVIDGIRAYWDVQGKFSAYHWDARMSGELFALPTGPVGLGVLAEVRHEEFGDYRKTVNERTALLNGSGLFDWSDPRRARTVGSAAAEFHVPLIRIDRYPFIHAADLAVAGRYDRYSEGYDSGLKPYFGLRVQPTRWLSLRASLARTFQAPSLPMHGGGASDRTGRWEDPRRPPALTGDPFDSVGTLRIFRTEGDPHLQPCHSRTWQAGFVMDLPGRWLKGLTLGATYSHLEESDSFWMEHFLSNSGMGFVINNEVNGGTAAYVVREPGTETYVNRTGAPIQILAGPNGEKSNVAPGASATVPGRISYVRLVPINLARQRAENWSFSATYARSAGAMGHVRWQSLASYAAYRGSERPGVPMANTIGRDYYPRLRMQSSVAWTLGEWTAVVSNRYIGPYGDLNRGSSIEVDSYSTFGAQVSREFGREAQRWSRGVRITLGVDNVFDRDPSLAGNAVGFDKGNALFPQGRVFYAQFKKTY